MTSILAIGNTSDYESYLKFIKQPNVIAAKYDMPLPEIKGRVKVIMFFPEWYWNKFIETPKYRGVYGNKKFYEKLKSYILSYKDKILKKYDAEFVVDPNKLFLDRDKEYIKKILSNGGVNVPKSFPKNFKKILSSKKDLFIKVRYGAMGKGITYITNGGIYTNFRFKNKIISRKSDTGWSFVKEGKQFLKALLKQDIIVEEAVDSYLIEGRKFDLRFYISHGKILYVYPRSSEGIVTNITQGGKGETQSYLKKIPKHLMKKAKTQALRAVKVYDVNFTSVDVLLSKNKAYVVELNVFPGFPRSKLFNLSKRLVKDIKR